MPESSFTPEEIQEILNIYFENFAHRQYIGQRYVPIFGRKDEESIQWDNTGTYEPLTIVLYQGNSYTSRQFVPAGVEITNQTYWANTGNYNAQVEAYRQEVLGVTENITNIDAKIGEGFTAQNTIADSIESLNDSIDENVETINHTIDGINDSIEDVNINIDNIEDSIGEGFTAQNTIANNIDIVKAKIDGKLICAEDYGAIGDGETDCTVAIQTAINENPNSCITFKGGVYLISNTIFLKGDVDSVSLDLNGSIIRWNGNTDNWTEGNAFVNMANHMGITSTPSVMFAVECDADYDRSQALNYGKTTIANGTIDCALKASIAIQNVIFMTEVFNMRIINFRYVGILVGTIDGGTYNSRGVKTSNNGRSTSIFVADCYITRAGNSAADPFTSGIMVTYPDNQFDNLVINHCENSMTFRSGGNMISNCHFTGEYNYWSRPNAANYKSNGVRLWPYASDPIWINFFDNIYFNAFKRAFYAYQDGSQNLSLTNFRTECSNSHLTFYSTGAWFDSIFEMAWFGGSWFGSIHTVDCGIHVGDNAVVQLKEYPYVPTMFLAMASETKIINFEPPHPNSAMHSAGNYHQGEIFSFCNATQPLSAGKYKKVAEIVTVVPTDTFHMPGILNFELIHESGRVYKKGQIIWNGTTYVTHFDTELGSTGIKMYISNYQKTYTHEGVTYYVIGIYMRSEGATASDTRFLRLENPSPFVDIYAFQNGQNYTSGNNQNVFDTAPGTLVEVF